MLACKLKTLSTVGAVGLLLACVRIARGQEFSLQIKGMGPQILSLARLYDVDRILQPAAVKEPLI